MAPLDDAAFEPVLRTMSTRHLAASEALLREGEPIVREFFVLDGVLRTWVGDAQGRSVTLAFQHHIASWLRITPVSLSRLRAQERAAPGGQHREA